MFPRNENRNEGTFAKTTLLETAFLSPDDPFWCWQKGGFQKGGFGGCSPGTKTGTRVRSPKPPFYETALLSPGEQIVTTLFSAIIPTNVFGKGCPKSELTSKLWNTNFYSVQFFFLGGGVLSTPANHGQNRGVCVCHENEIFWPTHPNKIGVLNCSILPPTSFCFAAYYVLPPFPSPPRSPICLGIFSLCACFNSIKRSHPKSDTLFAEKRALRGDQFLVNLSFALSDTTCTFTHTPQNW